MDLYERLTNEINSLERKAESLLREDNKSLEEADGLLIEANNLRQHRARLPYLFNIGDIVLCNTNKRKNIQCKIESFHLVNDGRDGRLEAKLREIGTSKKGYGSLEDHYVAVSKLAKWNPEKIIKQES